MDLRQHGVGSDPERPARGAAGEEHEREREERGEATEDRSPGSFREAARGEEHADDGDDQAGRDLADPRDAIEPEESGAEPRDREHRRDPEPGHRDPRGRGADLRDGVSEAARAQLVEEHVHTEEREHEVGERERADGRDGPALGRQLHRGVRRCVERGERVECGERVERGGRVECRGSGAEDDELTSARLAGGRRAHGIGFGWRIARRTVR